MSCCAVFAVGVPVAVVWRDERLLDACSLCFLWVTALRLQRLFRDAAVLRARARAKNSVAALLNPVLSTTLLMIAYTRLKAAAAPDKSLDRVLATFSSGTPLHALWTARARRAALPDGDDGDAAAAAWFGAGDAAMAALDCAMVAWGFKLYECRRQLFSVAGAAASAVCVAAAAASVFLSVLAARATGLDGAGALAFAARSTTLALAKPAVEAVGGNRVVNASLVVSNDIVGQLL